MNADDTHTNAGKTGRTEWRVLLVLALSLLLAEVLMRCFSGSVSTNLRNILATPETAARISRSPDEVRTVLVVGNSLARCGVDLPLLGQDSAWAQDGVSHRAEVELFAPDGTSSVFWDWGLKRYFANARSHPDTILLITGQAHLLDLPVPAETLGAYFVGSPDLGEALGSMQGSDESMRMLLGATSHLMANREQIRTRIGYSYLPGFDSAWPALTAMNPAQAEATAWLPETASTASLERFIATAREMGSELHVFSVPMPEPYELPDPVVRCLEKSNVPHHNLSALPGIAAGNFPDGYHLDKAGAEIFTEAILDTLKQKGSGIGQ